MEPSTLPGPASRCALMGRTCVPDQLLPASAPDQADALRKAALTADEQVTVEEKSSESANWETLESCWAETNVLQVEEADTALKSEASTAPQIAPKETRSSPPKSDVSQCQGAVAGAQNVKQSLNRSTEHVSHSESCSERSQRRSKPETGAGSGSRTASGNSERRRGRTVPVRRFLYPAASQIARDTPPARPRPISRREGADASLRSAPTSAEGLNSPVSLGGHIGRENVGSCEATGPVRSAGGRLEGSDTPVRAATRVPPPAVGALTPAEERDVQACINTIVTSLDDEEGDGAFFTQCRLSASSRLRANSGAGPAVIKVQDLGHECYNVGDKDADHGLERSDAKRGISSPCRGGSGDSEVRRAPAASVSGLDSNEADERGDSTSETGDAVETKPSHLGKSARLAADNPGVSKQTVVVAASGVTDPPNCDAILRDVTNATPAGSKIRMQSPLTTCSAASGAEMVDRRTPAGRPVLAAGAVRSKRLWSGTTSGGDGDSSDDDCSSSPVLASGQKRPRLQRPLSHSESGNERRLEIDSPLPPASARAVATNSVQSRGDDLGWQESEKADGCDMDTGAACVNACPVTVREERGEHVPVFAGFCTAGGQNIGVSEQAMKQASTIFEDVDAELSAASRLGSGKKAIRSAVNLSAVRDPVGADINNRLREADSAVSRERWDSKSGLIKNQPGTQLSFQGFKTAGGKAFSLSASAMRKASAMFAEVEAESLDSLPKIQINVNVSGHEAGSAQDVGSEKDTHSRKDGISRMAPGCSATSSSSGNVAKYTGKDVSESQSRCGGIVGLNTSVFGALNKWIRDDSRDGAKHEELNGRTKRHEISVKSERHLSSNAIEQTFSKPIGIEDGCTVGMKGSVPGFQTASGKTMSVTTESIAKVKSLFQDIDDLDGLDADGMDAAKTSVAAENGAKSRYSAEAARAKASADEPLTLAGAGGADSSEKASLPPEADCRNGPSVVLACDRDPHAADSKSCAGREALLTELEGSGETGTAPDRNGLACGFVLASGHAVNVSNEALEKATLGSAAIDSSHTDRLSQANEETKSEGLSVSPSAAAPETEVKEGKMGNGSTTTGAEVGSLRVDTEVSDTTTGSCHSEPRMRHGCNKAQAVQLKTKDYVATSCPSEDPSTSESSLLKYHCTTHQGFITGSGRPIGVSVEGLARAKAMLDAAANSPAPDSNLPSETGVGGMRASYRPDGQGWDSASENKPPFMIEKALLNSGSNPCKIRDECICDDEKERSESLKLHPTVHGASSEIADTCSSETTKGSSLPAAHDTAPLKKNLELPHSPETERPVTSSLIRGFMTGSGRAVAVSKEALSKAKALLREAVDDVNTGILQSCDSERRETESAVIASDTYKSDVPFSTLSAPAKTADNDKDMSDVRARASGAKDEGQACPTSGIEESALFRVPASKDTEAVLVASAEDTASETLNLDRNKASELQTGSVLFPGFFTGVGKSVSVSESALQKAKAMMSESVETISPKAEDSVPLCQRNSGIEPAKSRGFLTGTGKHVVVSEQALNKARAMLLETADREPSTFHSNSSTGATECGGKESPGRSRCSGNHDMITDISANEVKPSEQHESVIPVTFIKEPEAEVEPRGFKTGAGAWVQVSAAALKKAKAMLDETVQGMDSTEGTVAPVRDRAVHKTESVADSPDNADGTKPAQSHSATSTTVPFTRNGGVGDRAPVGLQTASGNPVKISEKDLLAARNAFKDVSSSAELDSSRVQVRNRKFEGFMTGAGKSVSISEKALLQARSLLSDAFSGAATDAHEAKPPAPLGFKPGSGNAANISEQALTEAKAVLNDITTSGGEDGNHRGTHQPPPRGFMTGSGSHVCVSDKAVLKARAMFGEASSDTTETAPRPRTSIDLRGGGFTTGSGTAVTVSEQALKLARSRWEEDAPTMDVPKKRPSEECSPSRGLSKGAGESAAVADQPSKKARVGLDGAVNDSFVSSASVRATRRVQFNMNNPAGTASGAPPTAPPGVSADAPSRRSDVQHSRSDSEPLSGLTQYVDDRFEFTQVVADRERQRGRQQQPPSPAETRREQREDEERSASPVLGTAPRVRSARRRSRLAGEAPTFRTPYRRGSDRASSRVTSISDGVSAPGLASAPEASAVAAPASALAACSIVTSASDAAAGAPHSSSPETAAVPDGGPPERLAAARRLQAELVAGGGARRALRQPGLMMTQRQRQRSARVCMRTAFGDRPARYCREELLSLGVAEAALDVTFSTAVQHRVSCPNILEVDGCRLIPGLDGAVGVTEVTSALLASPHLQPDLVPAGWIQNAYRHIVWKLAAYERSFPHRLAGRALTAAELLRQLRYRYDRELDGCQRPALRRIIEMDDTATKTLVLCVAEIDITADAVKLLISDGWYSARAQGDRALDRLARLGRLRAGQKLVIHGAEVTGQQDACSPLEASGDLYLRFATNSCRRARWDARLGYHSNPAPFPCRLRSVLPDGGSVARLDVVVARVYPLLYFERDNGRSVFRTARRQRRREAAAEGGRQARLERLYAEVERELASPERQQVQRPVSRAQVHQLSTGQAVFECLRAAADPSSIEALLTDQQKLQAAEYQRERRDQHRQRVESEFRARLQRLPEDVRPATPLLKVRLYGSDGDPPSGAILTLWRPSEELQSFLVEGRVLSVCGAVATGKRGGVPQLTAGPQCRLLPCSSELTPPPRLLPAPPPAPLLPALPPFWELDLAALVVRVAAVAAGSARQTVYLADRHGRLLAAGCWDGLQYLGLDDLVTPGAALAFANLQTSSSSCGALPLVYLTERTHVSRSIRLRHLADELELLVKTQTKCTEFAAGVESALEAVLSRPVTSGQRTPALQPNTPGPRAASAAPTTPQHGGRLLGVPGTPKPSPAAPSPLTPAQRRIQALDRFCGPDPDPMVAPPAPPPVVTPAQRRMQALGRYGAPPQLSPLAAPLPGVLRRPFRSPRHLESRPAAVVAPAADHAELARDIIRLAEQPASEAGATESPPLDPESQVSS